MNQLNQKKLTKVPNGLGVDTNYDRTCDYDENDEPYISYLVGLGGIQFDLDDDLVLAKKREERKEGGMYTIVHKAAEN
jgi:hypothetical protein